MCGKRNRSVQFAIFAATVAGIGVRVGFATPLIFEDFNPAGAGTDLATTPAGMGLTGNWFNASTPTAQFYNSGNPSVPILRSAGESNNGTQLLYPSNSSLPAPAGGTAINTTGGYGNGFYQAAMATPIPLSGTAGTYYFSYLLDNGNGTDFAAQLNFGGANTQIYAGFGYGSKDDISVKPNGALPFGSGNSYPASGGGFSQGFTAGNLGLVVGNLVTTASGADTVNVKLFRYTAGQGSTALPTSASGLTYDATYAFNSSDTLTTLGLFEAGVRTPEIDAIRVGTTYADVVGTVSAVTLTGVFTTYTGATSGSFDTTSQNFKFNGSSVAFANGNNVLFDDTATGTHNIVVTSGGVAPSAVSFNNTNASAGYNFTGGAINSPGMLTTVGNGSITLANANTYVGGVNLSNGSVTLAAGGILTTPAFTAGSGTLNLNGGILQAYNTNASFLTGTVINVLPGGGTIDTQGFNVTVAETLTAGTGGTDGGIVKIGSGTLTLQGHSSYVGGTTVNAGTVVLAAGGAAGTVEGPLTINSGGTVNTTTVDAIGFTTGVAVTTLTVNSGGTFNIGVNANEGYVTNLVMAGGTVSSSGGGSFNFNTGFNITSVASATTGTISSNVSVRGTAMNITTAAGTTPSGVDLAISGLLLGGNTAVVNTFGPGTLSLGGFAGATTFGGGLNVNGGTVILAAGGGGGTVRGPLTINSGTVLASATDALGYVTGANVTTLTVNSGATFVLGAGNEGYITNLVVAGGTVSATAGGSFNFNTGYNISSVSSTTTGTISSDIAIRGSSLNITTATGTTASGVDLNITGRLLGGSAAVLNTFGPGTLSLGGASTYGGGTVINGGTVIAANAAAFGPLVDNLGVALNGGAKLVLGAISAPSATLAIPEDLTYTGGGSLQIAPTPGYSSGGVNSITITDGNTVAITVGSTPAPGVTRGILSTHSVNFASSTSGSLDVGKNDLDLSGPSVSSVTASVATGYNAGNWNGPGIISSAAAQNSSHLTALGVIANDNGSGTPLYGSGGVIAGTFDGIVPADGDTLVKYTYYGDANLDGKVDGSDYSLIDTGYSADAAYLAANPGGTSFPATGWINGDFNYDGTVDGSDYTLIDNAFNNQGSRISSSALVAASTAQIASSAAVPEPALCGVAVLGLATLVRRRRGH